MEAADNRGISSSYEDLVGCPDRPMEYQQSASQMSSDIVEVTNISGGGVGFVAVGRPVQRSISENRNNFDNSVSEQRNNDVFTSSKRSSKTKQKREKKKKQEKKSDERMRLDDLQVEIPSYDSSWPSHTRCNSEPLRNFHAVHSDQILLPLPRSSESTDLIDGQRNFSTMNREGRENPTAGNDAGAHSINRRSRRTSDHHSMEPDSTLTSDELPPPSADSSSVNMKHQVSNINAAPYCKRCGQRHRLTENHEYDYTEEVDDDLHCDICLQPFLDPYDTKCGHTFCCVCLKNYIRLKKMCPIDRKDLTTSPADCWQASLVMRKLVDKLQVNCPNEGHCKLTLARSELEAHLKERCPGTMLRCTKAMFGCSYRGPRDEQKEHVKKCKFQHLDGNPVEHNYPDCSKHSVEIFRPEGTAELGLAIVGGVDTPLRNVIVQSIAKYGLVAEDGRILPGDIIIEVNGEDLHNISHVEARTILTRASRLMKFTILREKVSVVPDPYSMEVAPEETYTEKIAISLIKPPSDQLGIKITTCDDGSPGIYILELVEGRVAHACGQLMIGDRILEIAHIDLWDGTPEAAARIIQSSGERVDIIVSRRVSHLPASTIVNPWATDRTIPRKSHQAKQAAMTSRPVNIPLPPIRPPAASFTEKVISIKKSAQESLGIVVAGGVNSARGDLPIFVQDIQPLGVLGKDKRLMRGDLLTQVNGVQLRGLNHDQAISVLKDAAQHCREVLLIAIELNYRGKAEDFALWEELSGVHHQQARRERSGASCWASWTPSWRMWLSVPPRCRITRDVIIKRSPHCGLGFSIIGGRGSSSNDKVPVFVKYVVPNGPAELLGGVRCGDEIAAINGREASSMTHIDVVLALKNTPGSVSLTVMSWPGSVH
ncbi:unnamed protein product [Clavelina lepadiformis]|uniref:Uncharacterized protein n=1 Tax=Clavelina lepadiformis TaxID=159417 RepID=A0ABP0G5Y0_CLALP